MLKDEFEEFIQQFQGANLKTSNIELSLQKGLIFFEQLKQKLLEAPPKERESVIREIQDDYIRLKNLMEEISQRTGFTPEQMVNVAHDKGLFTPQQWETIENGRRQMTMLVDDISRALRKREPVSKPAKPKPKRQRPSPKKWLRT